MSAKNDDLKEEIIRTVAAMITMHAWREHKITLKKISPYAKRIGISTKELIEELSKRFERVGLKLRLVKRSSKISDDEAELFVVVDPRLKISAGSLDRITSAVLAIIFVRAGTGTTTVENILKTLSQVLGNEQKATEILSRALKKLEKMKLIKVDREKGFIELTSKALAILPEKEELEAMLVELISDQSIR